MPAYVRDDATSYQEVDRWDGGVGWLAHPDEPGVRASHAVAGEDGVWLFDPVDAPGVDDLVAEFGPVAGVAVCSNWHARDAGTFARRYDVPVSVPTFLDRAATQVDTPVERVESVAGFELRPVRPLRLWRETVAYRERDGTLYVPDFLTATPEYTVGDERVAMNTFSRLAPPREPFAAVYPERILFGHGPGVFEDAADALDDSFANARRRFPRALVGNAPGELRMMLEALR